MGVDDKIILGIMDFLKQKGEEEALKNITYIKNHINDSEEDICAHLGLLGDLSGDTGDFA